MSGLLVLCLSEVTEGCLCQSETLEWHVNCRVINLWVVMTVWGDKIYAWKLAPFPLVVTLGHYSHNSTLTIIFEHFSLYCSFSVTFCWMFMCPPWINGHYTTEWRPFKIECLKREHDGTHPQTVIFLLFSSSICLCSMSESRHDVLADTFRAPCQSACAASALLSFTNYTWVKTFFIRTASQGFGIKHNFMYFYKKKIILSFAKVVLE